MNQGEDARASHLTIMRGKGDWTTNYHQEFNAKQEGPQRTQSNTNLKKDLTQNHFSLG